MASTHSASAPLHSDHVNYLIWRYFQERGYAHAAVQLSRDWNKDPGSLPFAGDVKPHDLISVIQDGIMYDDLSSTVESRDKKYQFTVDKNRMTPNITIDPLPKQNDSVNERKRQKLNNGSNSRTTPQRSRNRDVVVAAAARPDGDSMEVDQNGSPMQIDNSNIDETAKTVEELPILVSTLSSGESHGVQQPPHAKTITRLDAPGADILDLSWSPGEEPELFASGGSIWRSWKLGSKLLSTSSNDVEEGVDEAHNSHHAPSDGVYSVSASARDAHSGLHASAFADDDGSVIFVDNESQETRRVLTEHHGTATLLRWDFNDSRRLLVVCQKASANEISLWKAEDSTCLAFVDTSHVVEDAAWAHDDHFILCGEGFLVLHRLPPSPSQLPAAGESSQAEKVKSVIDQLSRPIQTIVSKKMWAFVKYDPYTKRVACVAPDEGQVAIIGIENFDIQVEASHGAQITAIEWDDSIRDLNSWNENMRLLISSSTDGTVKIWNVQNSLECLYTLSMVSECPAMTLGTHKEYIAAAGDGQVCIWKLFRPTDKPQESPKVELTTVWHAPVGGRARKEVAMDIDSRIGWPVDEAPFHKVSWQRHHNLLAYSSGNQIHVIQVP